MQALVDGAGPDCPGHGDPVFGAESAIRHENIHQNATDAERLLVDTGCDSGVHSGNVHVAYAGIAFQNVENAGRKTGSTQVDGREIGRFFHDGRLCSDDGARFPVPALHDHVCLASAVDDRIFHQILPVGDFPFESRIMDFSMASETGFFQSPCCPSANGEAPVFLWRPESANCSRAGSGRQTRICCFFERLAPVYAGFFVSCVICAHHDAYDARDDASGLVGDVADDVGACDQAELKVLAAIFRGGASVVLRSTTAEGGARIHRSGHSAGIDRRNSFLHPRRNERSRKPAMRQ